MAAEATIVYAGQRYLLGYGDEHYGIWDRNAPDTPVERFPRDEQGWRSAWSRFTALEPNPQPAQPGAARPAARPAAETSTEVPARTGTAPGEAAAPRAGPRLSLTVSDRTIITMLRAGAWVALVVLVLAGIASLTITGGNFATLMGGLAQFALGFALWALLLGAASVMEKVLELHSRSSSAR